MKSKSGMATHKALLTVLIMAILVIVSTSLSTPLSATFGNLTHTPIVVSSTNTTLPISSSSNFTIDNDLNTTDPNQVNLTQVISRSVAQTFNFGPLPGNIKIAFVKPVFTATAYSSFYTFYSLHSRTAYGQFVKADVRLLNASLVNSWGWSSGLGSFISSPQAVKDGIVLGKNSFVISDVDVDQGALFYSNGTRRYNVAVVGFSEYLTQNEYNSYKQFVMSGGRLILLDACNFYAQVEYHLPSGKVSLLLGHSWAFNGTAAWRSIGDRWLNDSEKWVGSVYGLFYTSGYRINGATPNRSNPIGLALYKEFGGTVFAAYHPHEENLLTNPNDTIIAKWNLSGFKQNPSAVVAVYELSEGSGVLIHTCVFGSDIIRYNQQLQFFLREAIYPNAIAN